MECTYGTIERAQLVHTLHQLITPTRRRVRAGGEILAPGTNEHTFKALCNTCVIWKWDPRAHAATPTTVFAVVHETIVQHQIHIIYQLTDMTVFTFEQLYLDGAQIHRLLDHINIVGG